MAEQAKNNASTIWQMAVVFVALVAFWWNLQQALQGKTEQLSRQIQRLEKRQDKNEDACRLIAQRLTSLESHSGDQDKILAERVEALAVQVQLELKALGRTSAAESTTNATLLNQILKTLQDVESRLRKIEGTK